MSRDIRGQCRWKARGWKMRTAGHHVPPALFWGSCRAGLYSPKILPVHHRELGTSWTRWMKVVRCWMRCHTNGIWPTWSVLLSSICRPWHPWRASQICLSLLSWQRHGPSIAIWLWWYYHCIVKHNSGEGGGGGVNRKVAVPVNECVITIILVLVKAEQGKTSHIITYTINILHSGLKCWLKQRSNPK